MNIKRDTVMEICRMLGFDPMLVTGIRMDMNYVEVDLPTQRQDPEFPARDTLETVTIRRAISEFPS